MWASPERALRADLTRSENGAALMAWVVRAGVLMGLLAIALGLGACLRNRQPAYGS